MYSSILLIATKDQIFFVLFVLEFVAYRFAIGIKCLTRDRGAQ